ncbi:MAG: flagellar export protein FliJ [Gammaproteobacteria bacterium]|nr:flagellar export protein FliJ [Gammaproteobacteria bacterium]MDJ0890160.1 flagellar export protein FliJ [Gammaproteobacteria bacterium]
MSRSKRLAPVAGVAARREQHAAQTLKESRETLAQYEAQLRGLQSYRQEYVGGFQQAGSQGMQAGRMKDYLVFLDKLDAAISQLQAVISTSIERCERDKGVWLAKRAKLKALDKAIARYLKEEQQEEVRREQRDTDERAQQGGRKGGDG